MIGDTSELRSASCRAVASCDELMDRATRAVNCQAGLSDLTTLSRPKCGQLRPSRSCQCVLTCRLQNVIFRHGAVCHAADTDNGAVYAASRNSSGEAPCKVSLHLVELSAPRNGHKVAVLKAAAVRDCRKCAGQEQYTERSLLLGTHLYHRSRSKIASGTLIRSKSSCLLTFARLITLRTAH